MISIETGHNSIKLSLCHICGIDYPKPSLPSHVRRYTKSTLLSCIKTVSRPGSRVPSAKPIRRVSVNSTFTLVDKVTEKRSFSGPVSINSIPKVPVDHESVEERVDLSDHLIPCDICNRKFMKTRLEIHHNVCLKTSQKVRKVFNVQASRVSGTEMEKYVKNGSHLLPSPPKKTRPASMTTSIISRSPSQPLINPDTITCPSCSRNFNSESGKRHIPICKDQAVKKAFESSSGKDKEEKMVVLRKRLEYKPPKLKARVL